jgi:type IV pilus assembly protein PilM
MQKMAFFESKGVIGIDIGTSSVKILEIKESKNNYYLKKFGIARLPRETIVNGVIMHADHVIEAIREIISRNNIKTKNTVLSISGHPVIVKKISVQQMSDEQLEESIPFEVQQYIPFALEEVNIDFQILGISEEKKDQMNVILVAAKKVMINDYVNLITSAGLNPMIVDIDVFALGNMFEYNYPMEQSKNIALIDIGASVINMNIIRGGESAFTRDVFLGGHQISEEIQKQLGVTYDQAENLKLGKEQGGTNQEIVKGIVQKGTLSIVGEIQRSLDFYSSQTSNEINKIYLSGGVVKTPNFITLVQERTGVQAEIVDPLKSIRYDKGDFEPEYLKEMSPFMAVGIGLAMRRVGDK